MQWKLVVKTAGMYKTSIEYACSEKSVGHPISIKCGEQIVNNSFKNSFKSKYIEDYEQVPREVEADEQTWAIQEIGKIYLQKGPQNIELFTPKNSTNKDQIAEVKSLILDYTY